MCTLGTGHIEPLQTICRLFGFRPKTHNSPSDRSSPVEGRVHFVVLKVTSPVLENQKFPQWPLKSPFPWLASSFGSSLTLFSSRKTQV